MAEKDRRFIACIQDRHDYWHYVKKLGLERVDRLAPASGVVYKIRCGDVYGVLKVADITNDWAYNHVMREHDVLNRVKGVDGIVESVRLYGPSTAFEKIVQNIAYLFNLQEKSGFVALHNQYVEGRALGPTEKIYDSSNRSVLENAVKVLHEYGVAGLELQILGNIIIRPSGKPCLIDFGNSILKKKVPYNEFQAQVNHDLKDMEELFR